MAFRLRGAATVLGDYISADVVLPARHSFLPPDEMAQQALLELGADVNVRLRSRPILIAGMAFGYGTGRESPSRALKEAGVRLIAGGPFSRMLFRNAVNNGILVVDCPELPKSGIADGDEVDFDLAKQSLRWRDRVFRVPAIPKIVTDIVEAGDLVAYGRDLVKSATA
jgi:3-isopropylmalate/(R)-2-methylmalate dehydratase small subunit